MKRPIRRSVAGLGAPLAATLLAVGLTACGPSPKTYTVVSIADTVDRVINGTCADANGACTLRAALAEADADGTASTVRFALPGTGPHTITIRSGLPTLAEGATTIDGYSEPGSSRNTSANASNAVLKVQVRGTGPLGPDALVVTSAGNAVRGIAFHNLRQSIRLTGNGATGNVVAGNFIGTNRAGTFGATTFVADAVGVNLTLGASRNTVGGPAVADRNVVAGNAGRGVLVCSPQQCTGPTGANDNLIQNNLVGLNPSGTARRANLGHGLDVNAGSSRNRIVGNVISGNGGSGIELSHGTTTVANRITGNRIGTRPDGASGPAYARNTQVNIHIEDGPRDTVISGNVIGNSSTGGIKINAQNNPVTGTRISGNRIGTSTTGAAISNGPYGVQLERGTTFNPSGATDTTVGPGNVITGNDAGIRIMETGTVRNTVTRNSIFGNAGLGIDIEPLSSVNPNDAGDPDTGPNDKRNFPVLGTVSTTSVAASTCAGCTVEVFLADSTSTDPSLAASYGEGRELLASARADGAGRAAVALPARARGRVITSTATDASGNTSEFSLNRRVP